MNTSSRYILITLIILLATGLVLYYNFYTVNNMNCNKTNSSNYSKQYKPSQPSQPSQPITFTISRPQYMTPDLYTVPGSSFKTNMQYPYESVVPVIDVSRSDKQFVVPAYYMQYLEHNTSPFSVLPL